jgi:hypothetical protein
VTVVRGRPAVTAPARARREWRWWLLGGVLAGLALAAHASSWLGHNGDHYYYTSGALQFAGMDYNASLRTTTELFPYEHATNQLDYGYLNPGFAPLIYPRTVLGILALPGIHLFGVTGIYTAGLACGLVSFVVLLVWTYRRVSPPAALVLPALLLGTAYATEFMFGIYSEAPLICAVTLMMVAFPLTGDRQLWWRALAAAGLVPIMMLSRQTPLLPIGMVMGGWLWVAVGSRRLRNPWLPYLATIVPSTAASYALISWWAPYDVVPFLLVSTKTATIRQLLHKLPELFWSALKHDAHYIWTTDKPLILFTVLMLAGCVLAIRTPLAGVFLGSLGSGVATFVANGHYNEFRYLSPSLPMGAVLAALAVVAAIHRIRGTARTVSLRPSPPSSRVRLGAAAAWLAAVGFVVATVLLAQPAAAARALQEPVSQTQLGRSWPLAVSQGTLTCAGDDYQIWFIDTGGTRYAVSGTAMKRAFHPRIVGELVQRRLRRNWAATVPLLKLGVQLCGPPGRSYQGGYP